MQLVNELNPRIADLLKNSSRPVKIMSLAGDASTRSYFRSFFSDGSTAVIMLQANAGENEEEAFVEVHQFLERLGLPVPGILGHDPAKSVLLLEDLGDDLLETVTARASEKKLFELYSQAVDLLIRIRSLTAGIDSGCKAFGLAFDEEKLMQEMNFFMAHFVGDFCKNKPSSSAAALLDKFFLQICRFLAAEPRIFTHRDFHSRNLVLHKNRLVMIDFQDARMGPAQYDLASLLRDSYVTLPERLVDRLLDYYAQESMEKDQGRFRYVFDIMSLQRNIKALGTFGYQAAIRGSSRYLSSIPRTGAYIAKNVGSYTEFAQYTGVLEDYIFGPAIGVKA
ncbi:MAG: phosphotransferase [Desulfomonile tiedjei]|uniref:Phosphotransferase n=1 Tax=Desulfomonile tiedjei TaxID=2358 RepID=A0A9D6UX98_9BACT|nr:phosphotransferase [Desulfomonile tiedjei]